MRVLVVSYAERSHFLNLVPLAWALRVAGHEVRVASQPLLADTIVETGLVAAPPMGVDHRWGQVVGERADATWNDRTAAMISDSSQADRETLRDFLDEWTQFYFSIVNNEEFVTDLVGYAREWRPDLVVWEHLTWAGAVAAEAVGAASVRFVWGTDVVGRIRRDFLRRQAEQPENQRFDPLAEWLTKTLDRYGRPFTEASVTGHLTVDTGLTGTDTDLGFPAAKMRFLPYSGRAVVPDWLRAAPRRPRICVTAGLTSRTYFGHDLIPLAALAAFADLDVEVVATLVPDPNDPDRNLPDNVRLVDYVPLAALLPGAAAILHLAGAGSQSTATYYGVPQLVLPNVWDDFVRLQPILDEGAGLALAAQEISVDTLRDRMTRLVTDPSFAAGAERLRQRAVAPPAPADLVPILEELSRS